MCLVIETELKQSVNDWIGMLGDILEDVEPKIKQLIPIMAVDEDELRDLIKRFIISEIGFALLDANSLQYLDLNRDNLEAYLDNYYEMML